MKFGNLLLLSMVLIVVSCSDNVDWHTTQQGYRFYGDIENYRSCSWKGECVENLVHGSGIMLLYNRKGTVISKTEYNAFYGVLDNSTFSETSMGRFGGSVTKDFLPNGFGVLIDKDTITIATYKKGKITNGKVLIFLRTDTSNKICPLYIGGYKKEHYDGYGQKYSNGIIEYDGYWSDGKKDGIGKEYLNGYLVYNGAFNKDKREGIGKEYCRVQDNPDRGYVKYDGEWKRGLYDGKGKLFDENRLIYNGGWRKGKYHGKGILYDNGKSIEGTWKSGVLTKSYLETIVTQTKRTANIYITGNAIDIQQPEYSDLQLAETESEFIDLLMTDIETMIENDVDKIIDKRFNFWNLFRMYFQVIFKSEVSRAESAEKFICKTLNSKHLESSINTKIDFYNNNTSSDLKYVSLTPIIPFSIVTTQVAEQIFDRESMETADIVIDILLTILICIVIGFIIGFLIGFFIPALIPYAGYVDTFLGIAALVIGLLLAVFYGAPISMEIEEVIKQMIVENYMQYIDGQSIIIQIFN